MTDAEHIRAATTRMTRQMEAVLAAFETLPVESPAERAYGDTRAKLEAVGTPIGANDLLIGAYAIALRHVIVTDNEREFARIDGLLLENWLRPD